MLFWKKSTEASTNPLPKVHIYAPERVVHVLGHVHVAACTAGRLPTQECTGRHTGRYIPTRVYREAYREVYIHPEVHPGRHIQGGIYPLRYTLREARGL